MIGYRDRIREDVTFALSGILVGVGVAGIGLSPSVLVASTAYAVSGFGSIANTVAGVTLLQRRVPDRIRGRIFAVSSTADHLGAFVSTLGIGAGSGILSAAGLITGSGVVASLVGIASFAFVRRGSGMDRIEQAGTARGQ